MASIYIYIRSCGIFFLWNNLQGNYIIPHRRIRKQKKKKEEKNDREKQREGWGEGRGRWGGGDLKTKQEIEE